MSAPTFMSSEHVELMNEMLDRSREVASACARLDRDYALAYELSDGPSGTVHWTLEFSRAAGAGFTLTERPDADVVFVGDWAETIRGIRASRVEGSPEPAFDHRGDLSVLERIAEAFAAAHRAAAIDTVFPEV